jgi:DNA uptake protein ComE-like DNA-binding protein
LLIVLALRPRPQPRPVAARSLVVDVNRAGLGELQALPGVGRKTAARLVAGRPYGGWEQVEAVLGPGRLRRLRPFLRLE